MSRRHHHIGREPRTEIVKLTPAGESLLDILEVELRARRAYEIAERSAVYMLNTNRDPKSPAVAEVEWEHTDPETRRDYRLHVVKIMHHAEQLIGDRAAKGMP